MMTGPTRTDATQRLVEIFFWIEISELFLHVSDVVNRW